MTSKKVVELNPTMGLLMPDARTLQALARLSDNQDFVTLCEYMEKCVKEQDKKNRVTKEDTPLRQGQGVAQALESLLMQAYSAKENLRRQART